MSHRVPLIVAFGLGLLLLAWWLIRPSAHGPSPTEPAGQVARTTPTSEDGTDRPQRSLGPGVSPVVNLPQLLAGPDDIDPERRGPSNLPPGTQRTRLAASGKLAHYVIEEYADSFRECYEQHAAQDPDIPTRALLEFTITAEPRDTGDQFAQVTQVQVLTGGADYDLMEFGAFEGCCAAAVTELELDPPGGRKGGQMRFGMTIDLATGEAVDEARGAGQAQ